MISTGEIVLIAFFAVVLGVAIWWFAVAYHYGTTISDFSYSRGANIDPGPGKSTGSVQMTCDSDREICVTRATVICTGTNGVANFDISPLNPYASGLDGKTTYGDFNPSTTADLTKTLSDAANGKQSFTYDFDGDKSLPTCKGPGTIRPQLIASYTCIPKGQKCSSIHK